MDEKTAIKDTALLTDGIPPFEPLPAEDGVAVSKPEFKAHKSFLSEVWKRANEKNEDVLIMITGGKRKGKSWLSCRLGYELDPTFNVKTVEEATKIITDRVVHEPSQFIESANKLQKGQLIVLDEAGVGVSARKWYSFNNELVNNYLQVIGHKNLVIVFNLPTLRFLDKNSRRMMNYKVESFGVVELHGEKFTKTFVRKLQYNEEIDKTYRQRLKNEHGDKIRFSYWKKCENHLLLRTYEKIDNEWKARFELMTGRRMSNIKGVMSQSQENEMLGKLKENISKIMKRQGKTGKMYAHVESIENILHENNFTAGASLARRLKTKIEREMKENPEFRESLEKLFPI